MTIQYQNSENYSFSKNEGIFLEGQKAQSLALLLKGKVDVYICPDNDCQAQNEDALKKNSFRIFSVDQNIFIGSSDLFLEGKYSFSYHASEESTLYVYPVKNMDQIMMFLHSQKEYAAFNITSMSIMMNHTYSALQKLETWMEKFCILADNLSVFFWAIKNKYHLTHLPTSLYLSEVEKKYQQLKLSGHIPSQFAPQFLDEAIPGLMDIEYTFIDDSTKEKLEYYSHITSLPLDLRKSLFSADDYITQYHLKDIAQNTDILKCCLKEAMQIGGKYFKQIYSKDEPCIFTELICLINEINKYHQKSDELLQILDYLVKKITDIAITFQDDYDYDLQLDINEMVKVGQQLKALANSVSAPETMTISTENIPEELMDSAEKIIRYSDISNEKAELLRSNIENFRCLKNGPTRDADLRVISNVITPLFFELYEMVFKKVALENNTSKLFEMFLTFGYMDENLLSSHEIVTLYNLLDESAGKGPCTVYNAKEWLSEIHTLHKDPSINEFDQDYFDIFREMRKKGQLTDKDKGNYDRDYDARLSFEINNMFKINHKMSYGQVNTYFPVLHSAMITRDLSQALVTKDKVNDIIRRILEVDFSAFHRELFYHSPKTGVEKELISKAVFPDIILMPTFGSRGSMWQEITGRVRSTSGRFVLPIFTSEDLEDLLIKLVGNFRWELCRTMMGMAWNDITEKSLTSEYTDYIQFYKKNKDLSPTVKEKLKGQILRYNTMREIFTADYKTWITSEFHGNIRLNKVARSILYRYCPFEKSIRMRLERQPIFSELALPFNTLRAKKAKELESRYNKLLSSHIESDTALEENLRFYKDL